MAMYEPARTANVEAFEVTAENVDEVVVWCGGQKVQEVSPTDHDDVYVGINVPSLGTVKRASQGDFIAKNVSGRFEIYKKNYFASYFTEIS